MADLSVLIPARNEFFLKRTVEDILANIEGDTEVIAVLDGYWPNPPIVDHPRVTLIHHTTPVGQRAGTNEAARLSTARYLMKCDGHCAFDKGFDVKLMADCADNWVVVPRLYNLHGFDWVCKACGHRSYQGEVLGERISPQTAKCPNCGVEGEHTMDVIWKPRLRRRSDFARFDKTLHFQYWRDYEKRPESKGEIVDLMCHVGACWFTPRKFFKKLGMLDEKHGSWGQMGVEISMMAWMSGGRQVVNKKTWYSHMFRTQEKLGFPYKMSGRAQEEARVYSRELWMNNKWKHRAPDRDFKWMLNKFNPPEWEDFSKQSN